MQSSTRGQWVLFLILIAYLAITAAMRLSAPATEVPSAGLSLFGIVIDLLLVVALVGVWRGLDATLPPEAPSRRWLTPAFALGAVAAAVVIGLRLLGRG